MPNNPPPADNGTHRDELPYFGRKAELAALRKRLGRLRALQADHEAGTD